MSWLEEPDAETLRHNAIDHPGRHVRTWHDQEFGDAVMTLTFKDLEHPARYSFGSYGRTRVAVHDDDRWLLPVLLAAQNEGLVPQPALLITFDQHDDALEPRKGLGGIPMIRAGGHPKSEFLDVVENHLSNLDDDWIKAGMELGLISDVVAFGVRKGQHRDEKLYRDHSDQDHRLFINGDLPGSQLEYQGDLSDRARSGELREYWDVLGWESQDGCFGFRAGMPKIIVNIDLDCFAVNWSDYVFPWPDEVFEREVNAESDYSSTSGLRGKDVIRGLLERAGIITIAREPRYTGGRTKGGEILRSVARYFFDDKLRVPDLDKGRPHG